MLPKDHEVFPPVRRFVGPSLLLFIVSCGGDSATSTPPPPPPASVTIDVAPATSSVTITQTQQFSATVANTTNTAVTWKVNEPLVDRYRRNGFCYRPLHSASEVTKPGADQHHRDQRR